MHQIALSFVAATQDGEPVIGVIAFAIACWWLYFKMDKRDKDHKIKMKKLDKENEK